jgi:hypothetical protein
MDGTEAAFVRIANAKVDAYNRRDAGAWVAEFHEDAHYQPTLLNGTASLYVGRDALRQFLEDLRDDDRGQTARL